MKPLQQLCTPRPSVFDPQRRDTTLDIQDLVDGGINARDFLHENFVTTGMQTLLKESFRRLEGKSSQGIFKLRQAMGGGKTHNLITLGLLAAHPEHRAAVMGRFYKPDPTLGPVKVVVFSGRETSPEFGVWGAIAAQLGKREQFKDLYSPLQAPGQTAWETLLAGETVLIMLDELPFYLQNARAHAIGNSDLAQVTATALSNLLVAVGRKGCERVCLVLADLAGAYEEGSAVIADLEQETHRSALSLEPVRMNSDELYHILRKRLFEKLPHEREIDAIAQGYAQAIRDARQMDITTESPEQFATRIQASYPFHPSIRDLYARFRENSGFQQTRGLIKLMRIVLSRLWQTEAASRRYLINAYDLDFNDNGTLSELSRINATLTNAIAHDIASGGDAVAEKMDANLGKTDTQDAARLIYMASLANVPNAVLGLAMPEVVAYLAEPGRDVSRLTDEVLQKFSTAAWYLHGTRDGKLYFRNVQNLNAKLVSLVRAYGEEQAKQELRDRLMDIFEPVAGWCYQRVLILTAQDEIELEQDRVTLVISEPTTGEGLRAELRAFYEQASLQNRVAFLTGPRNTYKELLEGGRRLRAIRNILDELAQERLGDQDAQMRQARELEETTQHNFLSTVRETFTSLWYPTSEGLMNAELLMQFEGNHYSGEEQIIRLLEKKMKLTRDTQGDSFRAKCENRLFTAQVLTWREIRRRAASNPAWQWHHPNALEELKETCLHQQIWREDGGFIDKGPFPPPQTAVSIIPKFRDKTTGEVTLSVSARHGDTVFYDIGSDATPASARVDGGTLRTKELRVSFLAVDSTGASKTGPPTTWENTITLRHRIYQSGHQQKMEIFPAPDADIFYTTDGSDPQLAGGRYEEPFSLPEGTKTVRFYATRDGISSAVEEVVIDSGDGPPPTPDPARPVEWKRRHKLSSTRDSYEFLKRLRTFNGRTAGLEISVTGRDGNRGWLELSAADELELDAQQLEECLEMLRRMQGPSEVTMTVHFLRFETGQALLDWVDEARSRLEPGEWRQDGARRSAP